MKWFLALVTVVATHALPAPAPVYIGAENLLAQNASLASNRNSGLAGFGANTKGGEGGAVWTVWDAWALRDALNSAAPRIVYIRGRIDLTVLFDGSSGVVIHVGPFKTIIGGDANAELFGGSLRMVNQVHIIIQNLKINNAISYAPGEQPDGNGGILSQVPGAYGSVDSIDIERSEHIWVDHCELSDDPWNSAATPDDRRRHNGLLTIKNRSNYITISNNIFRNHNMNFLIGHWEGHGAEDTGRLKVTIYLNWFQGTRQRNPLARFGEIHILNNLYTSIPFYAIGVGIGVKIYGERNVFVNTDRAWVWASDDPNQAPPDSHFLDVGNALINSNFDKGISSNVGWEPSRYYHYNPMDVGNVEAHVRSYAGTW